ncbi:MAG: MMPL family transporter, partial [Gemmatimonadales bacterium]
VTMVGLAVGIDYSLLIVTRFREELNHGHSRRESAWRTMQTAGKAVVTSGLTVAVGFAALLITPAFETSSVGVGGMLVVTFAVLLTITLLPAVLVILGRAIDAPKALASKLAWYHAPSRWERWARWLAHHPWRAILLGTVFVGAITWPLVNMRIGLPREGWFPRATESGAGVEQLERIGSRGSLQPLRVVIQSQNGSKVVGSRYLRGLRRLSDALRADPRVADVRGPVDIRGGMSIFRYSVLYSDLDRARERYPEFTDAYISTDGSTTLMDVILADTLTFLGSQQLVRSIRSQLQSGQIRGLDSLTTLVGGFAASSVDVQNELLRQFPLVVGLILVVTAVMLFVAFQSILVPIKAVIMNSLSVAGAFGLMVLVFQQGVGAAIFGLDGPTEAVYAAVPVLVFAVVFGLSMDYEVFLLSRIKEAFERTHDNDKATMEGLSATASVITSAATIMIIVFGVSAFSRVLAAQLIGFGLAIAVALDATIIRMVLVPAIMHIAGDWNWWPGIRKGDPLRRSSSPSLTQRDSLPGQFYRTP